jgi:hypothetical protein
VLCCAAGSARAGKSGVGLLLLCDWEQFFLKGVRDLPLKPWQGGSIPLDTRPGEREGEREREREGEGRRERERERECVWGGGGG